MKKLDELTYRRLLIKETWKRKVYIKFSIKSEDTKLMHYELFTEIIKISQV